MEIIRNKIEEYGGVKKVVIKSTILIIFAYLMYYAFRITTINAYDESWKSLFTRHIEIYLSQLGFTVNEWSISIFMGSALGALFALILHMKDCMKYMNKNRIDGQSNTSLYKPVPTSDEDLSEHTPINTFIRVK